MADGYAAWSLRFRRRGAELIDEESTRLTMPMLNSLCAEDGAWYLLVVNYHWSVNRELTSDGNYDSVVELVPVWAAVLESDDGSLETVRAKHMLTPDQRDDVFDAFIEPIEAEFVEIGYGTEVD